MTRILSPDDHCRGVDVPFGRSQRYDGQIFDVTDSHHVRLLKEAGFTVGDISGAPSKADGFECASCRFRSYFRICSKCGSECERPDLVA